MSSKPGVAKKPGLVAVAAAREPSEIEALNQVRVRGRLAAEPIGRTLPSGAEIVSFRVVVARQPLTTMTRGSQQKSDWVECTAWSPQQRRRVSGWRVGDIVEVDGALRRRHYRTGESGTSRVDIEMLDGRRVRSGS